MNVRPSASPAQLQQQQQQQQQQQDAIDAHSLLKSYNEALTGSRLVDAARNNMLSRSTTRSRAESRGATSGRAVKASPPAALDIAVLFDNVGGTRSSRISPTSRAQSPQSPQRPMTDYHKRHQSTERTHQLATTTVLRYKKGEKIPAGCGIDDLPTWFENLHYDPKRSSKQMREFIAEEKRRAADARRRASHGAMERRLHTLSSALRTDLEVFVNYLLDYGSRGNVAQLAGDKSAVPSRETYLQLKILYDVLDTDSSGTLTYNELHHAAQILGRDSYDKKAFAKLDSNRSGSIDFLEMVKCFYPHVPMRVITKLHREVEKTLPANGKLTARDFLTADAIAEIRISFDRFAALPGGCTMENMLKCSSKYLQERPEIIKTIFDSYDKDGNSALDFEEFLEVCKFSYPPFTHQPPGGVQRVDNGNTATSEDASTSPFSLRFLARKNLVDPRKIKIPQLPTLTPRRVHEGVHDTYDPSGRRKPDVNGLSPRNIELLQRYATLNSPTPATPWRTATAGSAASDALDLTSPARSRPNNDVPEAPHALFQRLLRGAATEIVPFEAVTSIFPFSGSPQPGADMSMDNFLPSVSAVSLRRDLEREGHARRLPVTARQ